MKDSESKSAAGNQISFHTYPASVLIPFLCNIVRILGPCHALPLCLEPCQVYSFGCNLHGALGSGRCGSQEQAERVLGSRSLRHYGPLPWFQRAKLDNFSDFIPFNAL